MGILHNEIKSRVLLSSVIGRYVKLKRHNQEYLGCCPFHEEKTPSFSVNDAKQVYYCFGCGAKGDVFTFLERVSSMTHDEVLRELCRETGVPYPTRARESAFAEQYKLLESACQFFQSRLAVHRPASNYLKRRQVQPEIAQQFRLGYAPAGDELLQHLGSSGYGEELLLQSSLACEREGKLCPFFFDRLMFPIRDSRGRVVGFGGRTLGRSKAKYLNSRDTDVFHKGQRLFHGGGLPERNNRKAPVYIVEGYMDVLALWQHGIKAVAPLGTALTSHQLATVWRSCPCPVLCFDGDESGRKAMLRAVDLALPLLTPSLELMFLTLPKGSDPDSYLRKHSTAAWENLAAQAVPLREFVWTWAEQAFTDEATAFKRWLAIDHYLSQQTDLIAEPTVKRNYRQFFKDRIWSAKRGQTKTNESRLTKRLWNTKVVSQPAKGVKEKKILGFILYNPHFLNDIETKAADESWLCDVMHKFDEDYPGWREVVCQAEKLQSSKEKTLEKDDRSGGLDASEDEKSATGDKVRGRLVSDPVANARRVLQSLEQKELVKIIGKCALQGDVGKPGARALVKLLQEYGTESVKKEFSRQEFTEWLELLKPTRQSITER